MTKGLLGNVKHLCLCFHHSCRFRRPTSTKRRKGCISCSPEIGPPSYCEGWWSGSYCEGWWSASYFEGWWSASYCEGWWSASYCKGWWSAIPHHIKIILCFERTLLLRFREKERMLKETWSVISICVWHTAITAQSQITELLRDGTQVWCFPAFQFLHSVREKNMRRDRGRSWEYL